MRTRSILLFVGLSFVTISAIDAREKRDQTDDHLVPFSDRGDDSGYLRAYRKCWQRKLLVTSGEVARFVYLPGITGEETSVSIHRTRRVGKSTDYAVTATKASKRLWGYFTLGASPMGRADDVPIIRDDTPMPAATAIAIHALWMAALKNAREPTARNILLIDSSTEIYSAVENGRLLIAKAPIDFGPKTRRLAEVTNMLLAYVDAKPTRRAKFDEELRKEAESLERAFRD